MATQFQTTPSWDNFVKALGFESAWQNAELEVYDSIIQQLKEEDQRLYSAEQKVVQEKAFWACMLRGEGRRRFASHKDKIALVQNTAWHIERCWAEKACKAERARRGTQDDQRARQYPLLRRPSIKEGVEGNRTAVERAELPVATTLQETRYYLGHSPGDFIFEHVDPLKARAYGLESYDEGSRSTPSDKNGDCSPGSGSDKLEWPPRQFLFRGEVPRPKEEYLKRLWKIFPDVLKVVVSIACYIDQPLNRPDPALLQICRWANNGKTSREKLEELAQYCGRTIGDSPPRDMVLRARENSKIPEFAYLLDTLISIDPLLNRLRCKLDPLCRMLVTVTQSTWQGIVLKHLMDMKSAAFAKLEGGSASDLRRILVFQGPIDQSIHDFYRKECFRSDPSHPLQRYKRVDVSHVLRVCRWLRDPDNHDDTIPRRRKTRVVKRGSNDAVARADNHIEDNSGKH